MKTNDFCDTFCVLISLVSLICAVQSEPDSRHRIVETEYGKVRGLRKTTWLKGVDYYSFKGIPYAKSPTGELRFKAPEPVESWKPEILDAFEHGPVCIQFVKNNGYPKNESENCLFLNVFAPANVSSNDKLAVLVYIYGGAYVKGSGDADRLGPDFLLEQNVILVTLNYRLGVFGFLSLGTPEYSGNMALKDQQLALKWIHSNIEHFSGDKQRITLFGQSAGSASTHLHMLSSESRKYFRNAIPMSGVADNFWALNGNGNHLSLAHKIAEELGEPKDSVDGLVEFLKTVPTSKLLKYSTIKGFLVRRCESEFAPRIESKNDIRPFITDLPEKIYNESNIDVDVMFTFCSTEFILLYTDRAIEIYDLKGLDRNFTLGLPFRGANLAFDSSKYRQIAQRIREFYFKDAAIDERTLKQYVDLLSDINFAYGINKAAKRHATKTTSKSFYLRFGVDTKLSIVKRATVDAAHLPGASHADDICYIFRCANAQGIYDEILNSKEDDQSKMTLRAIDNMTKLFANFAKYGEPTHNNDPIAGFLPIQNDQVNFLDINNDGLKLGVNPNQVANELWAAIEQETRTEAEKSKDEF